MHSLPSAAAFIQWQIDSGNRTKNRADNNGTNFTQIIHSPSICTGAYSRKVGSTGFIMDEASSTLVPNGPAGSDATTLREYPDNHTHGEDETLDEAGLSKIFLICGYTPFIVLSSIANLLLIVTYLRSRKVRAVPTNALIFSLSIADFLVGSLVLTINLIWACRDYWVFGEIFCRLWSALDYTVTYMSTAMIVLISFDRYLLVTKNIRYRLVWTRKRAVSVTLVCWFYSMLFYATLAAPLIGQDTVDFQEECELELVYLVPFTIGNMVFEFGIPLVLILYLNARVYYKIYQISREVLVVKTKTGARKVRLKALHKVLRKPGRSDIDKHCVLPTISGALADSVPSVSTICTDLTTSDPFNTSKNHMRREMVTTKPHPTTNDENCRRTLDTNGHDGRQCLRRHQNRKFLMHRKAGITLSILVVTYLVCWLPYEVVSLLQARCGEVNCFSETTLEVVNGLLWCNSALNPFLYGLANPLIRREMMSLLGVPCWRNVSK